MKFASSIDVVDRMAKEFDSSLEVKSYTPFTSGRINEMYSVKTNKGDFVLRICNPRWDHGKLEKEILVHDFLSQNTSIPVPRVYYADVSAEKFPVKYVFLERLPGDNLDVVGKDLSLFDGVNISRQLGGFLGQMHSVPFPKFGDLYEDNGSIKVGPVMKIRTVSEDIFAGPFSSYDSLFLTNAFFDIEKLRGKNLERYGDLIGDFLEKRSHLLREGSVSPRLVHGDYKPSNVMVHEGRVSGVIDFDWAMAGNPEDSFNWSRSSFFDYDSRLPMRENLLMEFDRVYRSIIPKSNGERERNTLYSLAHIANIMGCFEDYVPSSEVGPYGDMLKGKADQILTEGGGLQ